MHPLLLTMNNKKKKKKIDMVVEIMDRFPCDLHKTKLLTLLVIGSIGRMSHLYGGNEWF